MSLPVRTDIRFWFRGRIVSVSGVSPQKTVLRWLREDQGATGTKEGCGEGDCGACTVAVGSLDPGAETGFRLRAVNSCLMFLPALDGQALFTVEDVARGSELHPVQKALVDLHGSQCGFCTPGFVMSLWSDYQERTSAPTREESVSTLSGNLCRCTGYRPILEAARAAWSFPVIKLERAPIVEALLALADLSPLVYTFENQTWYAPRTLEGAARLIESHPEARIVAGATDVGLWVTKGLRDLGDIVHLGAVDDLKIVREEKGFLEIGAGVLLSDAFAALTARNPGLVEFAERFASAPVKNSGTLGGNVANGSPIGDSLPLLLAMDASVVLRKGARQRELPLNAFFLGYQKTAKEPGELLVSLKIPASPGTLIRVWKISKRRDQDISAVCGAFALKLDGSHVVRSARLAFGGMAAIPERATRAESSMVGRVFDETALSDARNALDEDFAPLTDGRATAEYRKAVAKNLLTRFHGETAGQGALL